MSQQISQQPHQHQHDSPQHQLIRRQSHAGEMGSRSASFDRRPRAEGESVVRDVILPCLDLPCRSIPFLYLTALHTLYTLRSMHESPQMATTYSYYLPYCPYADFYDLVDSWIDVSSQPSSSSLSSIGDEIVTTGLRVQDDPRMRRRRALRQGAPTHLNITRTPSVGTMSSAEEYEESGSESDQVMMSSGEGNQGQAETNAASGSSGSESLLSSEDDDDENKTAINFPLSHGRATTSFTPLPNAFTHPPARTPRVSSHPTPGSYFPPTRPGLTSRRPSARHSLPNTSTARRPSCAAQNPLSPSLNTAAEHEEILRASLTSLLSVAAAARGLPKGASQRSTSGARVNPPMSFRLVPESALPTGNTQQLQHDETMFQPTLRRTSTSCSGSSNVPSEHKRKALAPVVAPHQRNRSSSGNGRERKKARLRRSSSTSSEDLLYSQVTPTLFTWVATAGVVVVLSALSFGAGYTVGKEAGRFEGQAFIGDVEQVRSCAREAGRSGLGLRRSLARSAVGVV